MQSRQHPTRWKRDVFLIHRSKLRLYQRRATRPQDEQAYRDPADLPQFDATDRHQIRVEMTDRFSDVETVRHEHVEPCRGDRAAPADMPGVPETVEREESNPRPPLTHWNKSFPPNPGLPLAVKTPPGYTQTPH